MLFEAERLLELPVAAGPADLDRHPDWIAGLEAGRSAIGRVAHCFHGTAWSCPLVLMMAVTALDPTGRPHRRCSRRMLTTETESVLELMADG